MHELARSRFRAGDLQGAIDAARGSAEPWAVALLDVTQGRWASARDAAEAALRARPEDALARWCRAGARLGLGDRQGALQDWSKVVADDPTSRTAWKDRAVLRALLGDRAGALEDLARLAALAPDDVVPHLWTAGLGGGSAGLEPFARGEGWTARLARLALGRERAEEVVAAAADERQRCQAHGYAGLLAERDGDHPGARRHYQACSATKVWSFLTHLWSRERLADMQA